MFGVTKWLLRTIPSRRILIFGIWITLLYVLRVQSENVLKEASVARAR